MRKRELVHFHALLDRIRWFVGEREGLSDDAHERYDELDVAPTAVYRSKQAHEDAVVTLTESLADAVDTDTVETGITDAEAVTTPTDETDGHGDDDPREDRHAHDDRPASAHSD
ncbi:UPF0058 family protein [Halomarina rubra]|uniref:UPF0058 family protein n=1 Tax=Halomarina rubra TaxID=2071873 RepID=A0ABD6ASF6_9EURY|nr:UPF0058 family protein [Halomarina rubra]